LIASDQAEAEEVFIEKNKNKGNNKSSFQSFDKKDRELIASEFH